MKLITMAGILAGSFALSTAAIAGACPQDQQKTDVRAPVNTPAKGVTDTTLAAIDLGNEPIAAKDRQLRFRRLTIEPGGIVPWHSHGARPAQIYVVKGTIVEYASNCAVPIVHNTGDISPEGRGTSHWWQNHTKEPVVLISVDIFDDRANQDKQVM